jgi:hypothetical protein
LVKLEGTVDGFTIRGVREKENGPGIITSKDHSGYLVRDTIFEDNGVGMDLASNGKQPTVICRNRFVANNEFAAAGGFGIFSSRGAQRVLISANKFKLHNGSAVFFADRGATQRDIVVEHNKSVDDKNFASIFNSSRVRLTANLVRARVNDPEFPDRVSAIFIGARNDDVAAKQNQVTSASGNGIDVTASGEPNKPPARPTNVRVVENSVRGAQLSGLHLAPLTVNVRMTGNSALGSGAAPAPVDGFDCHDESAAGSGTAGRSNTWTANVGRASSPSGLCAAPSGDMDKPGHAGKGHHGKQHGRKHGKHGKREKVEKQRPADPCSCGLLFPRRI